MDDFEREIRNALRRQEPEAGFSERVWERIGQAGRERRRKWFTVPALRWALLAGLCISVFGGLGYRYEQQQRAEGEAMRQEAITALQIAGDKIRLVQSSLQQISQ
jgi:hypothetical protein